MVDMNYIGSKKKLIPSIKDIINRYNLPKEGKAVDVFAGTGAVSCFLKAQGYDVFSNDWQYYSYVLTHAAIVLNEYPLFPHLLDKIELPQVKDGQAHLSVLAYLNAVDEKPGQFSDYYADGGSQDRLYFSQSNGEKIQAVRDTIESWKTNDYIDQDEYLWLIACLIKAADKVANTAAVYGAYLKKIKKTAQVAIQLEPFEIQKGKTPDTSSSHNGSPHTCFCQDSFTLSEQLSPDIQIAYLDPPYNHRQYSSNYHILETIARWDLETLRPRGKSGLRAEDENRSLFCLRSKAKMAMTKLIKTLKSKSLIFSYNNEGILSESDIREMVNANYKYVWFEKIDYNRFKSDNPTENRRYKTDVTQEYLVVGKNDE